MKEYSIQECEEGLKSIYSNMAYPRQIGEWIVIPFECKFIAKKDYL